MKSPQAIFLPLILLFAPAVSLAQQISTAPARIEPAVQTQAQADKLLVEANDHAKEREFDKALDKLSQALSLYRQVNNLESEWKAFISIGDVYVKLGEKRKALDFYNQALPLTRALGDRSGEATTLSNIGQVYNSLGENQKALDFYNQALLLLRAVGDPRRESAILSDIGLIYDSLGENQKALDLYQEALNISRTIGSPSAEAATLANIGATYSKQRDYAKALELYQRSISIQRYTQDHKGEAKGLSEIGAIHISQGEPQKALEALEKALELARKENDPALQKTILNNMGAAHYNLGHSLQAAENFELARMIQVETISTTSPPKGKFIAQSSKRKSTNRLTPSTSKSESESAAEPAGSTSSSQDTDSLIEEAVSKLRDGLLSFIAPTQMIQGKRETIEVRIASQPIGKTITEGVQADSQPRIQPVKVGPVMKVLLSAQEDAFRIKALNNEEQIVLGKPYAQWRWETLPLKSGVHYLNLRATVSLSIPGTNAEKPFDVPVLEKKIEVKVNYWYVVKEFATSAEGIKYIFGSLTIPSLIAAGLAYLKKRKESREEEERKKKDESRIITLDK